MSQVTKIFIVMDLEGIPGISDGLNSEFQFMNEEFTGHCDEQDNASEVPDDPHSSASVVLDKSAEDHA